MLKMFEAHTQKTNPTQLPQAEITSLLKTQPKDEILLLLKSKGVFNNGFQGLKALTDV